MKKKIVTATPQGLIRLKAVQLVQKGEMSKREIAEKFGVTHGTIRDWVKMYESGGLERLNGFMRDDTNISKAVQLVQKGEMSLVEIAQKFGVSKETITKWVKMDEKKD